MTDLATHLDHLESHLARFRDTGILNLIDGKNVEGLELSRRVPPWTTA